MVNITKTGQSSLPIACLDVYYISQCKYINKFYLMMNRQKQSQLVVQIFSYNKEYCVLLLDVCINSTRFGNKEIEVFWHK